jgi:hypothetical protein
MNNVVVSPTDKVASDKHRKGRRHLSQQSEYENIRKSLDLEGSKTNGVNLCSTSQNFIPKKQNLYELLGLAKSKLPKVVKQQQLQA